MKFYHRIAVAVALLLLVGVSAFAQVNSSLTGRVMLGDAPLPGVTVTIASPALQGTRTTVTDVNGNYNFAALPPGAYTVKLFMEGMKDVTKTAQLGLNMTGRVDATMRLTSMAEAITVTAAAPAVLETSEVQTNVQATLVNSLPMARTLTATTTLSPGVTTATGSGGAGVGSIQISGAPAYDSAFMVNGVSVLENLRGQPHNLFIEDAIQETTVLTAGISAEYGRFTGGVVNAITKSGGNEFSGSFRDNLTNDGWVARGKLNTAPINSKVNSTYEGTLGGRIIRDRLWFFGAGRFAKQSLSRTLTDSTNTPYIFTDKNTRYEAKLTGQLTDKHSLVASYLNIKNPQTNNCFGGCMEFSNIDVSRDLPNNFKTIHYNGILTNSLLIEGSWSKKYFAFVGSGGDFSDFAHGSYGNDYASGAGYFGAPVFCGFCSTEQRNNKLYGAKGTYYLASKGFGTHSVAFGYDRWAEQRIANNYQSGSNFAVYIYNDPVRPTCVNGACHPMITPSTAPGNGDGDLIKWAPILTLTQGSNFRTDSLYVNDKWDLNSHWSFNVGARYDKNDGVDSSGTKVAKDSAVSPRLGLIYDVQGNSRFRFNASYSKYVSRVAETIGSTGAGGGNPAYLYYEYLGPVINADHTMTTSQVFQQLYNWFQSVGGLTNTSLVTKGSVPGVNAHILGSLKSPAVDEVSLGFGSQISSNATLRVDLVHKNWKNFYTRKVDSTTGSVNPVLQGVPLPTLDVAAITNSDFFNRKYDALELQAAYRPLQHVNIGANYTYSKLKGNVTAETSGSGPVPEDVLRYPEYKAFAQNNPTGYLPGDQRHKLRAWIGYDVPTSVGSFNFSLLERYDSGTPYSAVGTISDGAYVTLPAGFQYNQPPSTVNYYFSKRGAYRWDNVLNTDLSVNYQIPVQKVTFFAQAKVLNVLNEQALILGDTTVRTARNSTCIQTTGANIGKRCAAFNPFTETPVEGINWEKGPVFGQGRNPTTSAGISPMLSSGTSPPA